MVKKEAKKMSDMKRMSISLPSELEEAIISLRKTDRFCRSSYAEIIREVLNVGLVKINSADLDEQHERDDINRT